MAAFSGTCDSKVSRASRLQGKDTKSESIVSGGPLELSDCSAILEKSQEFFQICDIEDKGFITQRDMQRLLGELPLSAEELENVFDTLDADGNGYLTPEEFSSGFSEFIFGPAATSAAAPLPATEHAAEPISPDALYQIQWEDKLNIGKDDEEKHFCLLMENLGASNVFEDPEVVRSLWAQLRRDEPCLLSNFEEFLARVTYQIKEAYQEKMEMETALKRKAASHDDEIQRLYEEMEQQIKNEKERIILQDSERFLTRSQDLEFQLSSKEKELELLLNRQKRLEQQCQELQGEKRETAVQNVKLKQYNEELAIELEHTTQELSLAQEQLGFLQEQASRLQEEKEIEMNKHLRDEQDMCYQKPKISAVKASRTQSSEYTDRKQTFQSDDEDILPQSKRKSAVGVKAHTLSLGQENQAEVWRSPTHQLQRIISIEEDHLPQLLQREYQVELGNLSEEKNDLEEDIDFKMTSIFASTSTPISQCPSIESRHALPPTSPRGQPVGKETVQLEKEARFGPDRLFKIVLVGNSSVGKTSLLRRFCDQCVDYSVKTLIVDNSQVALQMWDTAGQERYRSITKQFFRKADGVVVMYDITCEQSFTAVRSWLASVQEGAGDDIPVMLLGNKTDLEGQRAIQFSVGETLAKESRMIFFECSAFSGYNVTETMVYLARILKEQEDREKEKTVSLVDASSKKKSCC
ncbi:EF-hand calcium-binding domain-containing protein 4B [Bagarius yarrelli]|uniref:EF-hand calcium-binding domain-containing protein 4B n=1 Tax=Bagarius yarrelli TaxID=175774 RepID=A0A556TQS5_BAGYA|nr:EF-hand calcium-binding domain-containing protein 4B [Bagarius yarrelli]